MGIHVWAVGLMAIGLTCSRGRELSRRQGRRGSARYGACGATVRLLLLLLLPYHGAGSTCCRSLILTIGTTKAKGPNQI